ncbi:MAG: Crp/Fnr family transcriptional regulator [Oscillospiraceae bacterium]|nr:Crp/Fnr family transcriptional regulator [Oscillospiraceae bacterium]
MEFANYFPIWNKLTPEQQRRLRDVTDLQKIPKGTVVHDGSPECKGMVLVKSGQLRAYLLSDEGREITITRFFEMDICLFSASCVMPNMMFDVFIEAEKDTEMWVIPACLYQNLMEESLPMASYSRDLITNHFSEVMWLMEQIMWKSFDKRLAGFLVEESRIEETDALKITHEKIAAHMGTAREVVTRMLRYFQSDGMVKLTRGTVELTDKKALEALSEQ